MSAPAIYASGPCTSGWSAGLSIPGGALSGGRGKPDPGCERRELARVLAPLAPDLALRLLCADPMLVGVIDPAECIYVPIPVAAPVESVAPDLSQYATKQDLERAFKKSQSK